MCLRDMYKALGVNDLGAGSDARLFDLDGGEDDRRNRLEAAVDQLHIKMGANVLRTGRQFTKTIKAQRTIDEHINRPKQYPK